MDRQKVFDYIKKKYKVQPEYPWRTSPDSAVFRHADNNKWFALVMDVQGNKVGLHSADFVAVINLKIDDVIFRDIVIREAGIKKGDTVYLYVAAPVSAVMYKCKVLETDIPYNHADKYLTIKALMKIKLQKRYAPDRFTFDVLKAEYGIYAVRGPRGIPNSLSAALKKDKGLHNSEHEDL